MQLRAKVVLLVVVFMLLTVSDLCAQTTSSSQPTANYVLSQNLIGAAVWGRQGENLGQVEAIVINGNTGRISELVVSPSPQFEMGGKLVAVPWQKFHVTPGPKVSLDADKQTIARAPSFPRSEMPAFATEQWHRQIYGWWQIPSGAPTMSGTTAGTRG